MLLEYISVFILTLIGIYFFKKYADLLGLVDIPNERSMHKEKKISAAGIVFILSPFIVLFVFHFEHLMTYYYIYISIVMVLSVGIWDDIKDVSPKIKFIFIFMVTLLLYMNDFAIFSLGTYMHYELLLPLWLVFPFTFFAMAGYTNVLNLMDGLDGLAASLSLVILSTFFAIGWEHQDELLMILSSFFIITLLAFLIFNWYPATVFMGDTGSLMLGGVIASLAILLRKELLLPILSGVFMVETFSVMIQVSYFKYTRKKYGEGRRVFKMSPLHHHYQKLGMAEMKIATRFWIVGILLAIVTIMTLKIR